MKKTILEWQDIKKKKEKKSSKSANCATKKETNKLSKQIAVAFSMIKVPPADQAKPRYRSSLLLLLFKQCPRYPWILHLSSLINAANVHRTYECVCVCTRAHLDSTVILFFVFNSACHDSARQKDRSNNGRIQIKLAVMATCNLQHTLADTCNDECACAKLACS